MIITMKKNAPRQEIDRLLRELESQGISATEIQGTDYNVFGLVGNTTSLDARKIEGLPFVDNVQRVSAPYKLANRVFHPEDTVVDVGGVKIGAGQPIAVMAGPCAIENRELTDQIACEVKKAGAVLFRGGAYKPRTSPYSFQGLGLEGIQYMAEVRERYHMPIVTELMSADKIDEFVEHVDLIQVGARNMQNFQLLKELGRIDKPILLKRGLANTIEEWLMSAEYIMAGGNEKVILCERGIRTFEKYTRNTLDLSVVPIIKQRSHLPIVIDPSHATGDRKLVEAMSLAAIAAGADGLIIEVHTDPPHAASDGAQSLYPEQFASLMEKGRAIAKVVGRSL
ncbi:MAG: 3-deoxy-7-phosphoheptulonate synthase [Pygmaiobacter massiliensis]|jgi:3-deoxy-7-phosphoheptulonate synthase|nr:3-deoxy-7-phosphoheptulonate synthase [Pygmaiobacter massiliensis]